MQNTKNEEIDQRRMPAWHEGKKNFIFELIALE